MSLNLNFKYFDPRIVLDFEPEMPELLTSCQAENFIFTMQQHIDICEAIHYAEKEMIPFLIKSKANHFADLTPEQIVAWIKKINSYCGKTLIGQHGDKVKPGDHPPHTLLRWQKTAKMLDDLTTALSLNAPLQDVFQQYNLAEIAEPFLKILDDNFKDSSIKEKEHFRPSHQDFDLSQVPQENKAAVIRARIFDRKLHKLIDARNQGKLSEKDLAIINKVFLIAPSPEDLPQALLGFATQLIEKLRHCKGDSEDVSALNSFVFQRLTHIHPFINGNGRTAGISCNIFNVVFNYSTFPHRSFGDKSNKMSEYTKAVEIMDNDLSLLTAYFKRKLMLPRQPVSADDKVRHDQLIRCIKLAVELKALKNELIKKGRQPQTIDKKLMERFVSKIEIANKQVFKDKAAIEAQKGVVAPVTPNDPATILVPQFEQFKIEAKEGKSASQNELPVKPAEPTINAAGKKDYKN